MAIYSLNLGFISRSVGRSAVGFGAYISGGHQQDLRTGVSYDYGCKEDVIMSRILAPEGAPEWAKNSSPLWNRAEKFEDDWGTFRFKNLEAREQFLSSAQTAQTIMGAIPIEFTPLEAEACVEEFLLDRFVSRELVVEYALHWERGNPHFHGQITRRSLVNGDFSQRKDREIVSKAELCVTRKLWETVVNKHLELGGHEVRIDSRSHEDRGSLFLPTAHEGWYAQQLAERGQYSRVVGDNDAVRKKNIEILYQNPAALIQEVASKRTTFTRRHIEEEIIRRVGGDAKLFSLLKTKVEGIDVPSELILSGENDDRVFDGGQVRNLAAQLTDRLLANKEISSEVGENINREQIFTSGVYKKQEEHVVDLADTLHQRSTKEVSEDSIVRAIEKGEAELGNSFSEEQKGAISHLCSGPDIRLLNGKAGTGKTTLLKAVAQAYQEAGYQVMGTTFQGKAVDIMEQEVEIPCKTLDSFLHAWDKHQRQKDLVESGKLWGRPYLYAFSRMQALEQHRLTSNNVILVDEANMIGGHLWEPFLEEATNKGAKVLIIQDPAQIKSQDPGDYGRLFAERFGFCETNTVVRQRIPWQRDCSTLLNDYQILEGLKPYYDQGHFKWCEDVPQVHHALAQDYVKDLMENPQGTRIALAYKNTEVYDINQAIRQVLKEQGYLKESFTIHGDEYAIGDRIRFTQNDNHGQYIHNINESSFPLSLVPGKTQAQKQGVKNGSFGTIESFDERRGLLTVVLEDKRSIESLRRLHFNIDEYPHITHGYTMGIHKSEASTFDKSLVSLDPLMDPATLLVAMTRHRGGVQAYVNREEFTDFKDIVEKLSRLSHKETLQDYAVSEEQKPYFTRIQQYRDLMIEAGTLREEMEGELDVKTPLYKHSSYVAYQTCFQEKKRVAEEILADWKNHAPYTRLAGLRKDVLEVEAGIRPRLLSDLEYRASIQVQGYMDLVKDTRTLWHTISETHPGVLARSHILYADYTSKKVERDSLASVFQENLKLYTPFLRTTQDEAGGLKDYWGEHVDPENRVYLSALKSHAEAHKSSQLQNVYYERLPQDQKASYDVVKTYVTTRNEAAAVYSHLQNKTQESIQVTSPESFISLDRFHALQAQRDALALKVIDSPERYQGFFDVLKVKEDKLLEHAVSGEVREKVHAYGTENDMAKRASQAQELTRILTTSKDYRILKESGLDHNRLTFDIAFYDKVTKGEISRNLHPDQIYRPIAEYLKASHESARLWKVIQVRTREEAPAKDLAFQEQNKGTTDKSSLQKQDQELTSTPSSSPEVFQALEKFHELRLKREDLAHKILETPEKVQDFLEALKINEDKLLEQAFSKEIREKIQVYLKEEDMDQRLSQAQDLKKMLTSTSRYQYRLFKESGLDQNRLNFDAVFYEKLKSGELPLQTRPDHIYEPIQDYLEASKNAFLLWKKAEQQINKEAIDALKKDRQLALTARNENACLLAKDQMSLSIVSSMRQGVQRYILQQAGVIENESHRSQKTEKSQSTSYSQSFPRPVPSFISIEQVRAVARRNMTSLAIDLLGEPNKHMGTRTTLRFGTKGSLVVNIAGNREGLWNDFETGEKGDIVSLVQREKNLDFKEAISYLADVLNVRSGQDISQHKASFRSPQQPRSQDSLKQIKENAARLNAVSELNLKSKPIEGTLAETYLQRERNIKGPLTPDLRYIPQGTTFMYQGERRTIQHHCLAAFGRNQEERLSSVQLTKLDDQGKRALTQTREKLNKIHYGIAKGSFVLLQEDKTTNRVFVAEGIETALSLKEAGIKGRIVASMGIYNMENYQGSEKEIIICADNDEHKPHSQAYKTIEKTQTHFQAQGKSVSIIKPTQPGDDFNDVLKKQGPMGVQEYVKPYLNLDKQNPHLSKETGLAQKSTLDSKLSLREETLNRVPSSIPPLSSSMDKPQPSPIEIVSQYLESLLRKIKNFEGCSLADEAKQELKTYLQLLQKNEVMLQALKSHDPDLSQETHLFMQRQTNNKSKGMER